MPKKRSPGFIGSGIRTANGRTVGRINIYGDISDQIIMGNEFTPSLLLSRLEALGAIDALEVHIFSNGGDVFAGLAIYKLLKDRPEPVTAYVEGIAASIATVIICAADRVYMGLTDMVMIHDPMTDQVRGSLNARQARELADELEMIREPMIAAYMAKTGRTESEVLAVMDGEKGHGTWLSAEQAMDFGLVDEYTPDTKRPTKAAARVQPGVLALYGYTADLRRYPGAAKQTAKISKQIKGVNTKMAKTKKSIFPWARPKAEINMVEMVCPNCGADVLLNPETAEVALVSIGDDGNVDAVIEGGVNARRAVGRYRAQVFTVTCPHCANEFVWDTDGQTGGDEGEPVIETMEVGGVTPMAADARRAKTAKGTVTRKPAARSIWGKSFLTRTKAEISETTCPSCDAQVPYDTQAVEITSDENGIEGYALTCVACGAEFIEPVAEPVSDAIPMDASAAYRKGVAAERQRMLALDEMAEAAPGCESMIRAAKRSGASAQIMSRNVFKAMSGNPEVAGQRNRAAIGRDAQAAGINGLVMPRHYSPKSAYVNGVLHRLEDR